MISPTKLSTTRPADWTARQAYTAAAICFAVGLLLGYLFHGSAAPARAGVASLPAAPTAPLAASPAQPLSASNVAGLPPQNPPEVAAKAAAPVLAKLKKDPNNFDLLVKAGNVYMYSRVFPGAVGYYEKALAIRDDLDVRNNYAKALYYDGQTDAAMAQFDAILKVDPKNDKALFNRGMVMWQGKRDPQGAVASWKTLLELNPNHPRRADIEDLIAHASQHAH